MKAIITLDVMPESGVHVIKEGVFTRLFFDFSPHIPAEGDSFEDEYECENVDVQGQGYDAVVSAIVKARYTTDTREAIFANYEEAKDAGSDITEDKRAEYVAEYNQFQAWRKKAKQIAKMI
ncbi:MAG: hypothetical protein PHE09_10460 [Oscillospiraceae bacterium]|nr:hypothetical protein [Oscillospiraceae bacterium]